MRRYVIAGLIGAVLGWIMLALLIANPFTRGTDGLFIPNWNVSGLYTPWGTQQQPILDLTHKAVFLRVCMGFLQNGFLAGFIPACLAIGMVKLSALGKRSDASRQVAQILWVILA